VKATAETLWPISGCFRKYWGHILNPFLYITGLYNHPCNINVTNALLPFKPLFKDFLCFRIKANYNVTYTFWKPIGSALKGVTWNYLVDYLPCHKSFAWNKWSIIGPSNNIKIGEVRAIPSILISNNLISPNTYQNDCELSLTVVCFFSIIYFPITLIIPLLSNILYHQQSPPWRQRESWRSGILILKDQGWIRIGKGEISRRRAG